MARNNENRAIHGLAPSDQLLTMGDKKLQRAPAYKTFRHPSDVYSVDEIMDFIDGLMPAFVTRVSTKEDLKEFLQPRYSPKLLYFTKEEWVPKNIGKLSVHFNLRIDVLPSAYAVCLHRRPIRGFGDDVQHHEVPNTSGSDLQLQQPRL